MVKGVGGQLLRSLGLFNPERSRDSEDNLAHA